MTFSVNKALEILERTPGTLFTLIDGLSVEWTENNEGGDTWCVYDVIGHLIHGEESDWIVRAEIILSDRVNKMFQPFDRFAQFESSKGKSLHELLLDFKSARQRSLEKLRQLNIQEHQLQMSGVHPAFGPVTLSQLLSTWVVHDLDHISQIARIMAKQYRAETGPWIEYLKIIRE